MNNVNNETRIQEFKQILLATKRQGIENVLNWLEKSSDFFRAPSSTNYHCNYEGGLLEHSLNVYYTAIDIYNSLKLKSSKRLENITETNIAIAALLHDICKINLYQETVKWKKDDNGEWQQYLGYKINDVMPLGHGEKSVIILQMLGLQMTLEEMLAIRWHMGSWDGALLSDTAKFSYNTANEKFPLCVILQSADCLSALILEEKKEM